MLLLALIAGCENPNQERELVSDPLAVISVTYNGNGGMGLAPIDARSPYPAGSTVSVLGPEELAKEGLKVEAWNTRADGSGTTYAAGKTLTLGTSSVTLYAIWLDKRLIVDTSSESSALIITGVDDPFVLEGPLTIPGGVTRIAGGALGSSRVTSVTIASSVTEVGSNAFGGCTALTDVTFLGPDTTLGALVFNQCTNLVRVDLPSRLTIVSNGLFFNCRALQNLTLPDSVQSLGFDAFGNCLSLATIRLPDSLRQIKQWAFEFSGLTQIDIPSSVTSIETNPFQGCLSLTTVTLRSVTPPEVFVAVADSPEGNDWGENLDQIRLPLASLSLYQEDPRWSVVLALARQVVAQ